MHLEINVQQDFYSCLQAKRCTISGMGAYRIDVRQSEEGYSVSCPELPGCWSQGATEAEALANMQIAIQEYVDAAEEIAN